MAEVRKYPAFLIADVIVVDSLSVCLVEFLVGCADLKLLRYMYLVIYMIIRQ